LWKGVFLISKIYKRGLGVDNLTHYLSTHPGAVIGLIIVCAFILFFIAKAFFKMAIYFTIILLGLAGYFYYKGTTNIREAVEKGKTQTKEIYQQGKGIYEKGKDIIDKGKKASE
jgi:threonine/homoserine/homoserine lactone efflux protein